MYKTFVYVSGPITPSEQYPSTMQNLDRLKTAARMLFLQGLAVYCPAQPWFDEDLFIAQDLKADPYGEMYQRVIKMDLCILKRCDAIYMLRGWMTSKGCRIEHTFAEIYNKEIWYQ